MSDKPTQRLLPFDEVTVTGVSPAISAARYEPTAEALAAYDRLEGWLLDARGRPQTELAEQALRSLEKALLEGKKGWHHAAEDQLEALKLRNGKTDGDDIPEGLGAEKDDDFQRDVEDCLDALHEVMLGNGRSR